MKPFRNICRAQASADDTTDRRRNIGRTRIGRFPDRHVKAATCAPWNRQKQRKKDVASRRGENLRIGSPRDRPSRSHPDVFMCDTPSLDKARRLIKLESRPSSEEKQPPAVVWRRTRIVFGRHEASFYAGRGQLALRVKYETENGVFSLLGYHLINIMFARSPLRTINSALIAHCSPPSGEDYCLSSDPPCRGSSCENNVQARTMPLASSIALFIPLVRFYSNSEPPKQANPPAAGKETGPKLPWVSGHNRSSLSWTRLAPVAR